MREQRVLLEQVPDPPALGGEVDPPRRVEPRLVVDLDEAAVRPQEARDDPQRRALPCARGPDQGERLAGVDRQPDVGVVGAKGMGEVDAKRHLVSSLTDSSTAPLTRTSSALIASATSKSRSNCS